MIAGAWLAFKVAAKWAAWQHIAKLPDTFENEDAKKYLNARFQLSSNLLGRFLNGTLYNVFCAGVGFLFGKALLVNKIYLLHWIVGVFILVVILILIGVPLIVFPILGPRDKRVRKLKAMRLVMWRWIRRSIA